MQLRLFWSICVTGINFFEAKLFEVDNAFFQIVKDCESILMKQAEISPLMTRNIFGSRPWFARRD